MRTFFVVFVDFIDQVTYTDTIQAASDVQAAKHMLLTNIDLDYIDPAGYIDMDTESLFDLVEDLRPDFEIIVKEIQ